LADRPLTAGREGEDMRHTSIWKRAVGGVARQSRWAVGAVAALGFHGAAQARTIIITVDGVADPYLARQPAGTTCCSGDQAPDESPVLAVKNVAGGQAFAFTSTGSVGYDPGGTAPSAEGYTDQVFSMVGDYGTGISGPQNIYVSSLVGVFTTDSVPSGPAPPQLNDGLSAKTYSPGLNQIFFIGQGFISKKAGGTTLQTFFAPAGATRLYLGVADGGGWYNNPGKITTTINVRKAKPITRPPVH
jgi:hypothetical protein